MTTPASKAAPRAVTTGLAGQLRAAGAFVFRDYHLTRRYASWVVVFTFYAMVNSATIVLIGLAANDPILTLNLTLGVLMWTFLSVLFGEIANSISYERWEGTIEYTFMAPVSRLTHLAGVSAFAGVYAFMRVILITFALLAFTSVPIAGSNVLGVLVVMLVSTFAFMGLGLVAAVFPVMSPENGAQATNIVQGLLLLVSGVYYSVSVLPAWVQPLAVISPATYALGASRKLLGIGIPGSAPGAMNGQPLSAVLPELAILAAMGVVLIPAGLMVFNAAERWAKKTGKLKRAG